MQIRLFFIRGILAIAWAVVFVAASDSLTTGVQVLLVLYPVIDVVGSWIDARGQQGSTRQLLEINVGLSAVAAVALGIAANGDKGDVLAVFGVWALVTGVLQLAVTIRRRRRRRADVRRVCPSEIAGRKAEYARVPAAYRPAWVSRGRR